MQKKYIELYTKRRESFEMKRLYQFYFCETKNAAGKNDEKKRRKKNINHPNKYTLIGSKSTKKLRTWIPCKQHAFENWFICIVCIVIWVVEWLQHFCSILLAYTFAFQFSVKNISLFWLSTFFCASHLNISSQFHPNENWNGKLSCCRYNKEIARISWIH